VCENGSSLIARSVKLLGGSEGLHTKAVISTMSSASFQPILDAALADYAKQIGIDPVKHPIVDQLRSCHSPDDVLKLLENKAKEFKDYRDGNRKLIDCLKPVVKVIHAFSGIIGEAVSFVSRIPSSSSRFHYSAATRFRSNQQGRYLLA
jgi:hypothetical protein